MRADVVVVGGGIIGLSIAREAARLGVRAIVLERNEFGRASSWAGAGIVPPGNPEFAVGSVDRFRAISSSIFPVLAQALLDETGIDIGYRRCGGVEVFQSEHEERETVALWDRERIPHLPLIDQEPGLECAGLLRRFLPGTAQVRNPWYLRAMVESCRLLGVELHSGTEVTEWRRSGDRLTDVVTADGGQYSAGLFVLCAGAWTGELSRRIGWVLPVEPVRGQIVMYRTESPVLRRVVGVGKRYLVPREDGRVLVGSTEEPEARFDGRTTPEGIAELRRFAEELVPLLRAANVERTWAGIRPGSLDGSPYLGALPEFVNVWVAAGHFRAGIQLSPLTGKVIAERMIGGAVDEQWHDFRPDRRPIPPSAQAFRS